jgi:hypothetical protein
LKAVLFISVLSLAACTSNLNQGQVVAEAYGNKLYSSELDKLMNENTSFEDSVFITKEYINLWIRRQVLLAKSSDVLSESERNKSAEMQEYKNDLLEYETLNKLALNRIDTSISDVELEEYYEEHRKEFQLSQNIIKVVFFKIPEEWPYLDPFWKKLRNNEAGIIALMKKQAMAQNWTFYADDDSWVYFDDILKEIPINTYNQEHFLNNNKVIRIKEGNFSYLVKILDFKINSETSPLEMEESNIKRIILLHRQQAMVNQIETELIADAYNKNKVTIY